MRFFSLMALALIASVATAQDEPNWRRGRIENVTDYTQVAEAKARRIGSAATAPLPSTGSPKIPIILVQFDDLKFTVAETAEEVKKNYEDFFNGGEGVHPGAAGSTSYGSVKEYYRQQSNGLFTPEFTIIGPVTLSRSYTYYGQNSGNSKDINIRSFYSEACKLAIQQGGVEWSAFDNNNDQNVDMVFFVYAGEGENGSDDTNTIWPKESASSLSVDYDGTTTIFGAYGCGNELYQGKQDGIGLCIHEMGHGLGLPDFYDTNYKAFGLDYWDIMDSGCYQITGHQPCCMSAYELDFMGWRKLVELDPDEAYSLTLQPLEDGGLAYKVVNKANANEYFILENRQNKGFDTYFGWVSASYATTYGKNHGLMITHVDYNTNAWSTNSVNTNASHQRITLVPADGELVSSIYGYTAEWASSLHGDLYPGANNVTEMFSYSVFTGTKLGQTINNIQETAEGVITLDINGGKPDAINAIAADSGNGQEAIYSVAGQKLKGLRRGINIVRTQDGQVKKILK